MLVIKLLSHCIFTLLTLYSVSGSNHRNNHKSQQYKENDQISTKQLRRVSQELFMMLSNRMYQSIINSPGTVNYQNQRDTKDVKDEAPDPFFILPTDIFERENTTKTLLKLYDNYEMDSFKVEDRTIEEKTEEDELINSLLGTEIMIHTLDFLSREGYFPKNLQAYKNVLKQLWFEPYARSNNTNVKGSSGFEHVFLVEKRRNHITGLHNWLFFSSEEDNNKANYLGYIKKEELADKAAVIKFYLSYMDKTKLTSMFIGTPPEFEFALYTLCFYVRPNRNCNVLLGKTKITILSRVQHTSNGKSICTAYPKIY